MFHIECARRSKMSFQNGTHNEITCPEHTELDLEKKYLK